MTKKFRIWDNDQNKYRDSSGELRLSRTFETFCLGLHFQRESFNDSPWVSDLEIEQFTGLLDATGKEIYEGDIVLVKNYEYPYDNLTCIVKFSEYSAAFYLDDIRGSHITLSFSHCGVQINPRLIGNIHQNPELLS